MGTSRSCRQAVREALKDGPLSVERLVAKLPMFNSGLVCSVVESLGIAGEIELLKPGIVRLVKEVKYTTCPHCGKQHELKLYEGDLDPLWDAAKQMKVKRIKPGRKLIYFECRGTPYGYSIEEGVEFEPSRAVTITGVETIRSLYMG